MLWCSATFHSGKSAMLLAPLVHLFENPEIKMNRGEMENECVIKKKMYIFPFKTLQRKEKPVFKQG